MIAENQNIGKAGEASRIIEQSLEPLKPHLERYPHLWKMFRQCFLHTIDTTVQKILNACYADAKRILTE